MIASPLAPCPNCGALLPPDNGPTHRYIGASPACWALYSALNVGEPLVAPGRYNTLLVDAYAAQHYGVPSPPAIQSVAVHLITLYGILEQGQPVEQAIWLRTRPLRDGKTPKHSRFVWLTPPTFAGSLTVVDIVQAPTPAARARPCCRNMSNRSGQFGQHNSGRRWHSGTNALCWRIVCNISRLQRLLGA